MQIDNHETKQNKTTTFKLHSVFMSKCKAKYTICVLVCSVTLFPETCH